jgi:YD repeat-containing protein
MRKLILFLCLCTPALLFSQRFSEAPKLDRPVKQIIEWQTFPATDEDPEETRKGGVYHFRRDGKLSTFLGNDYRQREYAYEYDKRGRVVSVKMNERGGGSTIKYSYGEGFKKAEIKSDSLYLVTTHFLDGQGKVLEEKTSGKAWFTGDKFALISRKVLNYNQIDSLFGEMEYFYTAGQLSRKIKTVHHFDPLTNRKLRTEIFDKNGKVSKTTDYQYDEKNKLKKVQTKWPGEEKGITKEYFYKNGKLWQVVEVNEKEEERYESIFKDGRLVRTKLFLFDELITYTDFQYVFY